nr:hypothetical protein [Gammaproteobacteria bacterium]
MTYSRVAAEPDRSATADWRSQLRREIVWILAAKVAALLVLWAAFFSPSHRVRVTDEQAATQLSIADGPATTPEYRLRFQNEGGAP